MSSVLTRNNVQVMGNGPKTLIFAHGFGCDQEMWRFVAPQFGDEYRVVLFDYVGSGRSNWNAYNPDRYATLGGYVRDLLELSQALELQNAIFVGHSVSAMIGALAAIEAPELFERLIMVAPSPCYINHPPDYVGGFERADIEGLFEMMDKNYVGWAQFLAPVVINDSSQPGVVRELEQSFCSTDPDIARRFAHATFWSDNRADLPKVPVPSLVLQCTDDALAPLEVGRYLENHLPQSTLHVLKATGHCPHLTQPAETANAMRDYLNAK